jgi:hypothetical protein
MVKVSGITVRSYSNYGESVRHHRKKATVIMLKVSSITVKSMKCACTILSSVACPALPYFSTLSRKRQDFCGKKIIERKMFDWIFSTAFV